MTDQPTSWLARPGAEIAFRVMGEGPPLLLLHATLSSSRQLGRLMQLLSRRFRVVAVDRRGSGETRLPPGMTPAPIDVSTHVDDLAALIDAEDLSDCLVVGHSYGGCLALELAARRPALTSAVWVFEPPYAPLAPPEARTEMVDLARRTAAAAEQRGLAAAAETFLSGVSGQAALDGLSVSARRRIGQAGWAGVADAPLLGLAPEGLSNIRCALEIATGSRSLPLYGAVAEGIAERVPGAVVSRLPDLDHMAPVTRPDIIAAAVEAFATR